MPLQATAAPGLGAALAEGAPPAGCLRPPDAHPPGVAALRGQRIHGCFWWPTIPQRDAPHPVLPGRPASFLRRDCSSRPSAPAADQLLHWPGTAPSAGAPCHRIPRHLGLSPIAYVRWSDSAAPIGSALLQIPPHHTVRRHRAPLWVHPPHRFAAAHKRCMVNPASKACACTLAITHTARPEREWLPINENWMSRRERPRSLCLTSPHETEAGYHIHTCRPRPI